jgi:hypothetical protein
MSGQRAQSHFMAATKLASPHPALQVQSSQTRYLLAATSTNSNSRLFCHKESPSQIALRLKVRWSDAYEDALMLKTYLASRADDSSKVVSELVRAFMRKLATFTRGTSLPGRAPA